MLTSPYHPQSNGSLKRSHRTLGEYFRSFVNKDQTNWDEYVPFAMFAYNSSIHSLTGYQPYELLFGRKLELTSLIKSPEPQYNYTDYQFSQATLSYHYQIENYHNSILTLIGETKNERYRRGIERAFSRLANVLYGSLSNLDFDHIL